MSENWFQDGVKFECTACGKCCQVPQMNKAVAGLAELSHPGPAIDDGEVNTLAKHLGVSSEEFRSEFVAFCRQGYQTLVLRDGACAFYDSATKLCKVHEARPSYCRSFPFLPHPMAEKMFWDSMGERCEGINKGVLVSEDEILEKLRGRAGFVYRDGVEPVQREEEVQEEISDLRYVDD